VALSRPPIVSPAKRRRDRTLVRIALIWACNVIALFAADALVDGVHISPWWHAVTGGALLGLVNWAVKPIIKALALPLIIITLGIALFFVNLLVLALVAWLTDGLDIDSFGAAVGATIVLWLVNAVLHAVLGIDDARTARAARRAAGMRR
jgi:putative membrane protein